MANTYKGIGVHWGVGSTAFTLTNGKLQTRDHTRKVESEVIRDADGTTIGKQFYDPNEEATLEVVIGGSVGVGNVTPTLPACGDVVTLTDTTYTQISGSAGANNAWMVEDVATKSSNTSAMKATIKLVRFGGLNAQ